MSSALSPRNTGAYVTSLASHVAIDDESIASLASLVADDVTAGRLGYGAFKCVSNGRGYRDCSAIPQLLT